MKSASEIEQTAKKIRFRPNPGVNVRILNYAEAALEKSGRSETAQIRALSWYRFRRLVWAGGLAASFLIISSLVACFVLSRKNAYLRDELELIRRDIAAAPIDDSVTINFYLMRWLKLWMSTPKSSSYDDEIPGCVLFAHVRYRFMEVSVNARLRKPFQLAVGSL